jgi:hypothetical protein
MKVERTMNMEKKKYISPLMEVETISLCSCLMEGSPAITPPTPVPPHPGAPKHRTPVF